jgi:hypothetical protein
VAHDTFKSQATKHTLVWSGVECPSSLLADVDRFTPYVLRVYVPETEHIYPDDLYIVLPV